MCYRGILSSKVKRSNYIFGNKIRCSRTIDALRRRSFIECILLSLHGASICKCCIFSIQKHHSKYNELIYIVNFDNLNDNAYGWISYFGVLFDMVLNVNKRQMVKSVGVWVCCRRVCVCVCARSGTILLNGFSITSDRIFRFEWC